MFLLIGLGSLPLSAAQSSNLTSPVEQVGAIAQDQVVTPVDLTVIDPEKTEIKRRQEARKTPLIFKLNTNAHRLSQKKLEKAFAEMREKFRNKLESNFQRRVLVPWQLKMKKLDRLTAGFQRSHKNFPLSTNLARVWAEGYGGQTFLKDWSQMLAQHTPALIRDNYQPENIKSSSSNVKIFTPSPRTRANRVQAVLQHSQTIATTNVLNLGKARRLFQSTLPTDTLKLKRYLATFLQPNLELMEKYTLQWQKNRTASLWAADSYKAGDIIVAQGEMISPKIKRALNQLNDVLEKDRLKSDLDQEQSKNEAVLAWVRQQSESAHEERTALLEQNFWMIAAAGLLLIALAVTIIIWRRQASAASSLALTQLTGTNDPGAAMNVSPDQTPVTATDDQKSLLWKNRALQAERKANSAMDLLRSRHGPNLFRWLKSKFVQNMVSQHKRLQSDQEKAEEELQSLIERLSSVHTPVAERLRAYEARIKALEKELQDKDEETRALIKAKLEAMHLQIRREKKNQEKQLSHLEPIS